jgi:hypothetical protein
MSQAYSFPCTDSYFVSPDYIVADDIDSLWREISVAVQVMNDSGSTYTICIIRSNPLVSYFDVGISIRSSENGCI